MSEEKQNAQKQHAQQQVPPMRRVIIIRRANYSINHVLLLSSRHSHSSATISLDVCCFFVCLCYVATVDQLVGVRPSVQWDKTTPNRVETYFNTSFVSVSLCGRTAQESTNTQRKETDPVAGWRLANNPLFTGSKRSCYYIPSSIKVGPFLSPFLRLYLCCLLSYYQRFLCPIGPFFLPRGWPRHNFVNTNA